MFVWPSH